MSFAADQVSSSFGIGAGQGIIASITTSTTMGTGTGSHLGAWTA
jgi:hypothetical protein